MHILYRHATRSPFQLISLRSSFANKVQFSLMMIQWGSTRVGIIRCFKWFLNIVILSTPIVCIVLVIINIFIILHGHTMKFVYQTTYVCIQLETYPDASVAHAVEEDE